MTPPSRLPLAAVALICAGPAAAGGIDLLVPDDALLFEPGTVLEFRLGQARPKVSGTQQASLDLSLAGLGSYPSGSNSGDIAETLLAGELAFKTDLTPDLSVLISVSNRYGADISYAGGTGYLFGGSSATLDGHELRALLRYSLDPNWSLIGGLRMVELSGDAHLFEGYDLDTSTDRDIAPVLGFAWSRPGLGQRVSLIWEGETTHHLDGTEVLPFAGVYSAQSNEFTTKIPQSVTLDARTGIAPDTLLFGSVRWSEWSVFDVSPALHKSVYGQLAGFDNDVFTYRLGLGHRFNDVWSGAVAVTYEPHQGGFSGHLGPTDGARAIDVSLSRKVGSLEIAGSIGYSWIGSTKVAVPEALGAPADTTLATFSGNSGVGIGLQIRKWF